MADNITALFQNYLGRTPTGYEFQYFNDLIEKGDISPYEISYFLQMTPEYQRQQAAMGREEAVEAAKGYQEEMFPVHMKQIESEFAQRERPDTSAVGQALAQQAANLARERGMWSGQMAREDVLKPLGQAYQTGRGAMQNLYGKQAATTAFGRQQELARQQFERQKALMELQHRYREEEAPSFLESFIPGAVQAGATIYGGKLAGGKYGG